jgi:hypothetical protein
MDSPALRLDWAEKGRALLGSSCMCVRATKALTWRSSLAVNQMDVDIIHSMSLQVLKSVGDGLHSRRRDDLSDEVDIPHTSPCRHPHRTALAASRHALEEVAG